MNAPLLSTKREEVMLSKDKIIGLGYHMMEEIDEAGSPLIKKKSLTSLKL